MFKKTFLGALIAAGSLVAMLPGTATAQSGVIIQTAPPPPIHEVVPAPRSGFVWAPGHYRWRGDHYVWMRGHWMPERYGYAYREPRWIQRGNGEWHLIGGDWLRRDERYGYRHEQRRYGRASGPHGDPDHDGVPNRFDRFPYNPNRS